MSSSSDPTTTRSDTTTDRTTDTTTDPVTDRSTDSTSDRSLTDRFGSGELAALLIVVGIGLFIFPEPATSTIGIILIIAGIASWALGRFG